ncbi:MAG TPA: AbrB/MazE/SpoVT family DNA-binding domain-containing protein [Usitatibacter sp.]|nr:AbrB/MazE/SpoVT family DNA-binding domain-containing protein [Usitatibacter sp.]
MPSATLTSKGQITIPKEVRENLGVDTGDRVDFVEEEKGVYRVVAATRDVTQLKGIVRKPANPVRLEDMKRAVRTRGGKA